MIVNAIRQQLYQLQTNTKQLAQSTISIMMYKVSYIQIIVSYSNCKLFIKLYFIKGNANAFEDDSFGYNFTTEPLSNRITSSLVHMKTYSSSENFRNTFKNDLSSKSSECITIDEFGFFDFYDHDANRNNNKNYNTKSTDSKDNR